MEIEIQSISYQDKSVLRNLLELYQHDFAEFDGADVDEHGLFGYKYLDHYWTEEGRHPYFVKIDGNLAGFAMIRDSSNTKGPHELAEFFIMRKYRRQGIGRTAALKVFNMFPGTWHVSQVEENHPSQLFWRRVISEYTDGNYKEITLSNWKGPVQEFESRTSG